MTENKTQKVNKGGRPKGKMSQEKIESMKEKRLVLNNSQGITNKEYDAMPQAMQEYSHRQVTSYLSMLVNRGKMDKPDPNLPQQLQDRIEEYFDFAEQMNMKLNPSHLALALGVSTRTLYKWLNDNKRPQRAEVIETALAMIEGSLSSEMQYGGINPVSGIFLLKNWAGYKNENEVVVQGGTPVQAIEGTAEEIAKKYLDSAPIDDE